MKIKKFYKYTTKNQIWRLLISDSDKLLIETRNGDSKEAFFSSLNALSGKILFKDFQFEEKFWLGVDKIYKDVVFLHKFAKPDMPQHKSIIAFDLESKTVLWENEQFSFQFITEDKVFASLDSMTGTKYFQLNYLDGEPISELDIPADKVVQYKAMADNEADYSMYKFPEQYAETFFEGTSIQSIIKKEVDKHNIDGAIEFIELDNLLLFNYHKKLNGEKLQNIFCAVDIHKEKMIFKEVVNASLNAYVPDSFFIYKGLIFLLKERNSLIVCQIKE